MRLLQALTGIVLLFLALIGCATPIDFGDPFPKSRPAEGDLTGMYRPTNETRELIAKGGYEPRTISFELRADGTCQIQNIPDWWLTGGKPAGGFDSGSGKWRIVQQSSWWGLNLDFPSTTGFARPDERSRTKEIYLIGQTPPYEIMITMGDPDGSRMYFWKVPTRPAPTP